MCILWTMGILCGAVFLICAIGNAVIVMIAWTTKGGNTSMVPLVGGFCGTISVLSLPVAGYVSYWWVPLLLDIGCAPSAVAACAYVLLMKVRGSNRKRP